jgi:hypothetical protein
MARGPRDRTYRAYLVRENPWLQLQSNTSCHAVNLQSYREAHQNMAAHASQKIAKREPQDDEHQNQLRHGLAEASRKWRW